MKGPRNRRCCSMAKLLVHVKQPQGAEPLTGEQIWQAEGIGKMWGTPAPTRIGGVAVVVTARGQVVRVSDGKVLATGAGKLDYASPLVVGDTAYFIENGGQATRLSPGPKGRP